jgi:hypothetical protein
MHDQPKKYKKAPYPMKTNTQRCKRFLKEKEELNK